MSPVLTKAHYELLNALCAWEYRGVENIRTGDSALDELAGDGPLFWDSPVPFVVVQLSMMRAGANVDQELFHPSNVLDASFRSLRDFGYIEVRQERVQPLVWGTFRLSSEHVTGTSMPSPLIRHPSMPRVPLKPEVWRLTVGKSELQFAMHHDGFTVDAIACVSLTPLGRTTAVPDEDQGNGDAGETASPTADQHGGGERLSGGRHLAGKRSQRLTKSDIVRCLFRDDTARADSHKGKGLLKRLDWQKDADGTHMGTIDLNKLNSDDERQRISTLKRRKRSKPKIGG